MDNMEHRTASDSEWEKAMQHILEKYDWDWSKHYPKRDTDAWHVMIDNFVHEYMDGISNYDEENGMPGSRHSEEVISFLKFLALYPNLRFFQALSIWSGNAIY